jgi:DNA-binding NarL/FixJ family response regulator
MIRVAIVDDHPALREGIAALIERERDIEVVALPGTLAELRTLLSRPAAPDIVVLDIRLGEESGLRMLGEVSTADGPGRAPRIILWTAYDYPQYAAFARRAGAAGFVVKTAPVVELVEAIRVVAAGGTAFGVHEGQDSRRITSRELDVLRLVVEGLGNDQVAAQLGITTRTVEAHLTRLFERSGTQSRTELATRALREGWLDLPPS